MTKRTRINLNIVKTMAEFEQLVDTIAQLQLDQSELTVERDTEKERLLAKFDTQIKGLKTEIERLQTQAATYAQANWKSINPEGKSATSPFARYGFRTGNPTLKLQAKAKEADVAAELHAQGLDQFVVTTYSLNKECIAKAITNDKNPILMQLFRIEQDERFFVECKAQRE